MRTSLTVVALLLVALVPGACSEKEGAPDPTTPTVPATVPGCAPDVFVPGAGGGTDAQGVLDPHADTLGVEPLPFQVRLGWPGDDPSISVSMLWRTDVDTLATVVEYGIGAELTERVTGSSFRFGGVPGVPGPARMHEVRLCGALQPGTTYTYRVGGEGAWSDPLTFTTPGAPENFESFRVAVLGDSRGAYETLAQLYSAIDAADPDVILFTGDMVEFGGLQSEWDGWFGAAGDLLGRIPLVPAHGNHEFMASHYFAQFGMPGNEQWFAVRFGSLQLVVLNDTVLDMRHITEDQPAFLDEVLATDALWKVVMHHKPAYTDNDRHGPDLTLRSSWTPKFDAHEVDLVLNGHNHTYERFPAMNGGAAVADGQGPVYVVSGGGGADLYDERIEEGQMATVFQPAFHYLIGDFTPQGATFTARDAQGNVLDTFSLSP